MADEARRGMTISLRAAWVGCFALVALAIAPGALPGAPEQWGKWSPIADAYAYQVKQLCEEKVTSKGTSKKCKSVLVPPDVATKKEPAAGATKDAKVTKDAKSKDPHSGGPPAH